jgi:hypothetical protein
MSWLDIWLGKNKLSFSITRYFSFPDASSDRCQECGVTRRAHGQAHRFAEHASKGDNHD